MEAKEFFNKSREICLDHNDECKGCPLDMYCCDGVFASDAVEANELIKIVEEYISVDFDEII